MRSTADPVHPAPLRPVATGLTAPLAECPAALFDGWMVHDAALRAGMNTLLFPGQALLTYPGEDHTEGSAFAHGVPDRTWLSGATLVQDIRITTDVLADRGIPVPRSRAFSLRRGQPFALRYAAEEIGYPVVVKPVVGESTVEVIPGIEDERGLIGAIDYLRSVPIHRPDFTTASYAFTQILTPRTGTSTKTRGTYKFLVQEHVHGTYVRLLVSDDEVLSAVRAPRGPWLSDDECEDVTDRIHPDLAAFAVEVRRALPGIPVASIDVVCGDLTAPMTGTAPRPVVVDVAERPWLHVQNAVSPELAAANGRSIYATSTTATAPTPVDPDAITVDFTWEGLSQVEVDIERAKSAAHGLGLSLRVASQDRVTGIVTGELAGPTRTIALLSELIVEGDVLSAPAMCVETRPVRA